MKKTFTAVVRTPEGDQRLIPNAIIHKGYIASQKGSKLKAYFNSKLVEEFGLKDKINAELEAVYDNSFVFDHEDFKKCLFVMGNNPYGYHVADRDEELAEKQAAQELDREQQINNGLAPVTVSCESAPHEEDLSNVILNRPAPNLGAFLIHDRLPKSLFQLIKPFGYYYSSDDLEEFDMFYSEPGWRFPLQALDVLLKKGVKLKMGNYELSKVEDVIPTLDKIADDRRKKEEDRKNKLIEMEKAEKARISALGYDPSSFASVSDYCKREALKLIPKNAYEISSKVRELDFFQKEVGGKYPGLTPGINDLAISRHWEKLGDINVEYDGFFSVYRKPYGKGYVYAFLDGLGLGSSIWVFLYADVDDFKEEAVQDLIDDQFKRSINSIINAPEYYTVMEILDIREGKEPVGAYQVYFAEHPDAADRLIENYTKDLLRTDLEDENRYPTCFTIKPHEPESIFERLGIGYDEVLGARTERAKALAKIWIEKEIEEVGFGLPAILFDGPAASEINEYSSVRDVATYLLLTDQEYFDDVKKQWIDVLLAKALRTSLTEKEKNPGQILYFNENSLNVFERYLKALGRYKEAVHALHERQKLQWQLDPKISKDAYEEKVANLDPQVARMTQIKSRGTSQKYDGLSADILNTFHRVNYEEELTG